MRVLGGLFPRWRPRRELRPSGSSIGEVASIEWLGTAGFVFRTKETCVLVDPFVSRHSLGKVLLSPLTPSDNAIRRHIPSVVHAVVCGHSHFDHVADAPRIAVRSKAKLIGSQSTCAWGRMEGVPDRDLVPVPASGAIVQVGDVEITMIPSKHGRVMLGPFPVPVLPGTVHNTPRHYGRVHQYKMGGAFGVLLRSKGLSVYHNGSADLVDAELEGHQADVLLACLAGRKSAQNYVARLAGALSPKLVIPAHHDAFFSPLEHGVHLLPGIDLDGFVDEVRLFARGARVITLGYGERVSIAEHANDASIVELLA